jgi:hypothetical protein
MPYLANHRRIDPFPRAGRGWNGPDHDPDFIPPPQTKGEESMPEQTPEDVICDFQNDELARMSAEELAAQCRELNDEHLADFIDRAIVDRRPERAYRAATMEMLRRFQYPHYRKPKKESA